MTTPSDLATPNPAVSPDAPASELTGDPGAPRRRGGMCVAGARGEPSTARQAAA